jgi:hypothetical protein
MKLQTDETVHAHNSLTSDTDSKRNGIKKERVYIVSKDTNAYLAYKDTTIPFVFRNTNNFFVSRDTNISMEGA